MEVKNPKTKIRLNLDLSPKVSDKLTALKEKTDAASLVEVIRRSLAVYDMFLDHEERGGKTILVNQDGTKELVKLIV